MSEMQAITPFNWMKLLRHGDRVEAGQLVAQLDPSDLETDVIERSNTVKRYEKNLQQIELAMVPRISSVRIAVSPRPISRRRAGSVVRNVTRCSAARWSPC